MAGERYDPLPGLTGLPKHVWTHLSPRGRRVMAAALALLVLGGTGLALAIGPDIGQSKEERAAEERERREEARAALKQRLEREQRPLSASGPGAPPAGASDRERLRRRGELLAGVSASVLADARARAARRELRGPIRRVECEPYPRNVRGKGAEADLGQAVGRYSCLAITTEVERTELSEGSSIGHPYRARVDFESGRYAWCKISGRPGEGSLEREQLVTVPPQCGG